MTMTPDEVFDRLPNVGDRVIYTTKTARHGRGLELEMRKGFRARGLVERVGRAAREHDDRMLHPGAR